MRCGMTIHCPGASPGRCRLPHVITVRPTVVGTLTDHVDLVIGTLIVGSEIVTVLCLQNGSRRVTHQYEGIAQSASNNLPGGIPAPLPEIGVSTDDTSCIRAFTFGASGTRCCTGCIRALIGISAH